MTMLLATKFRVNRTKIIEITQKTIFNMAAVRHIGFATFDILSCDRPWNQNLRLYLRCLAKFGEDRTMRGRVIAYFRFFKMAPVRHLGLGMTS